MVSDPRRPKLKDSKHFRITVFSLISFSVLVLVLGRSETHIFVFLFEIFDRKYNGKSLDGEISNMHVKIF
jgi:hypothetical protein